MPNASPCEFDAVCWLPSSKLERGGLRFWVFGLVQGFGFRVYAHLVRGFQHACLGFGLQDLIAASIHDGYSVGASIRPIRTRSCLTMTDVIQVCSNFHCARAFIINARPDEIRSPRW